MERRPFYYKQTRGIRITVRPLYLAEHSQPLINSYVFAYFIRIENVGKETVQLLSRRWLIHDSNGEEHEVVGDGVVGEQPVLAPGAVHEYHSFCVLRSPNGSMEGTYHFVGAAGEPQAAGLAFDAIIPQFLLAADEPARPF